ncbi:putative A-kinase anchor protein 10, mitochondrial [Apostichopus japonicus]|uniref:Putative A-kinase anchor protein 10, mitochondrial n=1 Tax=Stichopus japonicus TaxID=307972 RepID=A0A2G8KIA2_STIJA|nr:putative A-kinase anchor protein 10, mitochondrial [Apostichopus japonicus]
MNGRGKGHRRNISDWKNVDPKTAVERDAINIYTKFLCKDAATPVGLPEDMRLSVMVTKICPPDGGQLDPDCFKEAQEYVYSCLEKQYFPEFLRSEFHCKYQVDILTSGKVYLADVLYNESATSYLMEYLDQEGSVHMLHFWLAAGNFQQQLLMQQGQYDAQQAQDDAMVLYDKYFSLQAEHPLGFDFAIRCEIESNICREGGPLPNCFAAAMKRTFTTLETVFFPGFLSSQLYYKFLSELINSMKTESKIPPIPEEASKVKETPKPQKNTLLADGVKKLMESDMTIDPLQLDPDTLWKRSDPGDMTSFGMVDSMGQFVPGFEVDPESVKKRTASKFSLKKLVTKEEDKAKEQMALQIAQMIINDVTVQTKGSSSQARSPDQHPS